MDFNEYATDPPEPIRNVRQRIGELQEVGQDEGMVEAAADRLLMEEQNPPPGATRPRTTYSYWDSSGEACKLFGTKLHDNNASATLNRERDLCWVRGW